jgi:hypothetical protein
MNSICIEFENGQREIVSRNSVRRIAVKDKYSAVQKRAIAFLIAMEKRTPQEGSIDPHWITTQTRKSLKRKGVINAHYRVIDTDARNDPEIVGRVVHVMRQYSHCGIE